MASTTYKTALRKLSGSAMTETPAAIFILIILIFLPLLSLIALAFKYFACYNLNSLQSTEAALLAASKAKAGDGLIIRQIPRNWKSNGMGNFVDLTTDLPETEIRYEKGQMGANSVQDYFVFVKTSFTMKPFISVAVPLLNGIPGLSAPVTFQIESSRAVENPNNVDK
ncbi:MAG: hypothetical protein K2X27_11490 [Candidatus Obscuribacterales bacterium]|nr:hypothetical protein [Candidatus Obscuribacterales bacterium]